MVATTATQAFPYPTGPDRPCDSWKTWRDMAVLLDGKLTSLNDDVNRTARAVPMAKVSSTTPTLMKIDAANSTGGYPYVKWDTVEADTDGIVDFSRSTDVIWPKRPGKWWLRGILVTDPVSTVFAETQLHTWITSGTSGSIERSVDQVDPVWTTYNTVSIMDVFSYVDASFDYTFGLTATVSGPTGKDPTAVYASLTAVWMADLP